MQTFIRNLGASRLLTGVLLVLLAVPISCGIKKSTAPTAPTGPSCTVTPAAADFGSVAVGSTFSFSFQIGNAGTGTLSGTCSTSSPGFSIVGTASYSLTAGQSQSITVRFAPTAAAHYSGSVSTGCSSFTCSGVGITAPYSVLPETLSFGRSQPDERQAVQIHNAGTSTLSGTMHSCPHFVIFGDSSYAIAPGDDAYIQISFRPAVSGAQSCQIQTGLPLHPTVTATGFGRLCDVSPPYLDLGDAWEQVDQTFTVANPDSFPMTGTVTSCGPFGVLPTSYNLAPGGSQTFTARFDLVGRTLGPVNCQPDLGQGTCPVVTLSASDEVLPNPSGPVCAGTSLAVVDFGTLAAGQVGTRTITVRCIQQRQGGGSIPCGGSLVEQSASLSLANAAFSGLAVGDSAHVTATFSSMEPGVHHCTVMLTTNDNTTGALAGYMECRATVLPAMPYRTARMSHYR